MEGILPLPKVVRRALIELSMESHPHTDDQQPEQVIQRALGKTENKHRLARIYLGRSAPRTTPPAPTDEKFSIRNTPLYLYTLKHLDLDINNLANQMEKGFAIMHWGTGINGDDVEFVPGTSLLRDTHSQPTRKLRQIEMFLLDFGQRRDISSRMVQVENYNGEAVEDAVEEVYQDFQGALVMGENRLLIPNLGQSPGLYGEFRRGYKFAARCVLESRGIGWEG